MDQILNSLIKLNSLCDGAAAIDGQGFNKIDCCIVPFLLENFTEDAAAVGYTLLKKYTKQLKGLGIEYDKLPKLEAKSYREFKETISLSKDHNIFTIDEKYVEWKFPYNPEIITAIKKVPMAKYNADNKSWKVRLVKESLIELKAVFELFAQLELPSEVIDLVDDANSYPDLKTIEDARLCRLYDNALVFDFEYNADIISTLKSIAARWNPVDKNWFLSVSVTNVQCILEDILKIAKTHKFKIHSEVFGYLNGFSEKLHENELAQTSISADIDIKKLQGELKSYQKVAVEFMSRNHSTLLADEMGLGKTIESIAAIEQNEAYPCLIVTPATVKYNWLNEIKKWIPHRNAIVFDAKKPSSDFDILIINYDILKKLPDYNFASIICDESHKLKNYKTKQTENVALIAKNCKYRYLLTGTPIINRPSELLSQLTILDKLDEFGGFWNFAKRYCNAHKTRYGWDFSGSQNEKELKENLRKVCLLRRKKSEVLSELPDKQRTFLPTEIDNKSEYKKAYNDIVSYIKESIQTNKKLKAELKAKGLKTTEITKQLKEHGDYKSQAALKAIVLVKINNLRRIVGEGKVDAFMKWADTFLEAEEKLVIFAHHKTVQEKIAQNLTKLGVKFTSISGGDSALARQNAIDKFQTDSNCRVIVCSIKAAGIGITLTAASNVAILEFPWTPADCDQAEDRCHRIGQKNAVNAWYFKSEDTIDEYMHALIDYKRQVTDLDQAKEEGIDHIFDSILKQAKLKI